MSFSLSKVDYKKRSKQMEIKECYGTIMRIPCLTENVKLGVWKYAEFRFSKRCRGQLTSNTIQKMVQELLEKICIKPFIEINITDVSQFENEILYHIKRAIFYGATRSLYYDINDIDLDSYVFKDKLQVDVHKPVKDILEKEDVLDYFKDLMV